MRIAVVGGGRWARTITAVLETMRDRIAAITVYTPGNSAGIEAWISERRLGDRIRTQAAWPTFDAPQDRPDAVVIANRAGDHFTVASAALRAGVPALVEKPVCLSQGRIEQLGAIARASGTVLAASHVFLFARYVQRYADAVEALGSALGLRLVWTDGASDVRRGEAKSYDPTVTVFDDVLPHVVPILGQLAFGDLSLISFDVQEGGARLAIEMQSAGRPVSLTIARNAEGRRRHIEVMTEAGSTILDFSKEPGLIDTAGVQSNGDPLWDSKPRPLATMLSAFIDAASGGSLDARLSPGGAIAAACLADALRGRYFARQGEWFETRSGKPPDPSLRYALAELGSDADAAIAAWSANDRGTLMALLAKRLAAPGAGHDKY